MKDHRPLLVGLVVLLLTALAVPSGAAPVCSDIPREVCGGRVFAEAETTVSFVQHDTGEFEAGIKALAEEFPRYIRIRTFSEMLGEPALSAGGREIWMMEISDFRAPELGKKAVAVSLSVHGPERAGLEGGVRYAEDLARWATDDPTHELRNGTDPDSIGIPVGEALKKVHIYLTNMNPDGWAEGDFINGGVFVRGNANGVDLNRQFPTKGWTQVAYDPLSQPEAQHWNELAHQIAPVTAGDLHGELTSANNAYADIMYPAGQWNPLELAKEERMARHMASNVARYFEEAGVEIGAVTGVAGMKPAEYATAYDIIGYDDSGFMGDFLTEQVGAIEMDVEHLLSHMVPNSEWVAPHEDAHIAAVRAEIETYVVEAIALETVRVRLDLGRAGYLFDPKIVTSRDGYGGPKPPQGVRPAPYRASRMRFFRDLGRFTVDPLRPVTLARVASGSLRGLDSFVIAGNPFRRGPDGSAVARGPVIRALKRFVSRGGNLVLTDGALKLLPRLGVIDRGDVARTVHNAGHIDIETFEDPYLDGVHTTASQTYYEVPLGYSVAGDFAPHFTVSRAAWEGAGSKPIAHVNDDEARIGLGRVEMGKGTIGIFGALLPDPTERFDHFFGLADYAVTVAGAQILNNMISFN
ncbi:MAG TPA: M14 family zinc carboxypeptidase [Actinomycetota bacterium]|nr:M14 family zinc carboxypeptidase [Actinomycetota bacterium]